MAARRLDVECASVSTGGLCSNQRELQTRGEGASRCRFARSDLFKSIRSKLNISGMFGIMVDSVSLLLIGGVGCRHDAWHESLWIAIIEWKPRALNLNHQTMPRQDRVINLRQRKGVFQHLICSNRFRFRDIFPIATSENIGTLELLHNKYLSTQTAVHRFAVGQTHRFV